MKFCNQCKKEINTNANYCTMCGTKLQAKKQENDSNKSSIISIILFAIVVVLNGIFLLLMPTVSDDPIGAGQALGFIWAFMVMIPSIPLLLVSTILSIINIVSYFKNKKITINVQRKKTVLVTINIIQIILTLLGLIFLFGSIYIDSLPTEEGLDYTIETINEMFINTGDKYEQNEINIKNVHKFNQLLSYVDSIMGKDTYYLGSLYTTDIPHDDYTHYVVKIIPKNYIEQFNSWTGSLSSNPYLIMFIMETYPDMDIWHEGMYDNYYETFILGMKYKEELEKEFISIDSKYEYLVDYNTLLNISVTDLGINSNSTWQDGLNIFSSKSKSNLPSMLIIAPYGTTEEEGEKFIDNNKETFNKYFVKGITLCVLKENEKVTDNVNVSRYDSIFETHYSYKID